MLLLTTYYLLEAAVVSVTYNVHTVSDPKTLALPLQDASLLPGQVFQKMEGMPHFLLCVFDLFFLLQKYWY